MKNKKGFTLIELLVVIAIIGLLSTLAVVALNNARAKSRDAKRVSDIKQAQTALELCYNDGNAYPSNATETELTNTMTCWGQGGADNVYLTTYIQTIPTNPSPDGATYVYTPAAGTTYSLQFTLEGSIAGLQDNADHVHTATPAGIQ